MLMDQDTQWLYHLLAEVQLEKFYLRVRDGLNITRIEHFAYVKEADLEQIGISKPGEPDCLLWSSTPGGNQYIHWRDFLFAASQALAVLVSVLVCEVISGSCVHYIQ